MVLYSPGFGVASFFCPKRQLTASRIPSHGHIANLTEVKARRTYRAGRKEAKGGREGSETILPFTRSSKTLAYRLIIANPLHPMLKIAIKSEESRPSVRK